MRSSLYSERRSNVLAPWAAMACLPFCAFGQTASDASRAHTLFSEGQQLVAQSRFAEADLTLTQAAALTPDDVTLLTLLGKVQGRVGRYKEAVQEFQHIVQLQPKIAENHLNLAIALADAGDKQAALDETGAALALAPNSAQAHLNRARLLADLKRPQEAAAEFETACRLDPKNPDGWFYWALLARETYDLPTETRTLQRLVELQPENDLAYFLLGRSLRNQSRIPESMAALRRAIAINPNAGDAMYMLAGELREKDPQEAQALMQRFQATRDSDKQLDAVKVLGNQAYAAYNRQDWPESIRLLHEAIASCERCSVAAALHRNLGLSLCKNGQVEEGIKELEMALQIDPNDHDSAVALKILKK